MITGQKDYVTPKQGLILKYQGTFDLKKLYNSSKEWFKKNNYVFSEKEYKEKPVETGTEFILKVQGDRKIDDYTGFNISLSTLIRDTKKMNGKYKGNLHLNASAYVLLDRENRWQTNSIKKFLFFFYNNFILKNKIINVYEDKLYTELTDLINNIKKYTKLN